MISIHIREKIREIRIMKGISQEELADLLNMSFSSYAKMERGISKIDVDRLYLISSALKVSIWDLLPKNRDLDLPQNTKGDLKF